MLDSTTTIVGNLAADPVLDRGRNTYCRFTVLVKARTAGERTNDRIDVIARGILAENAFASLDKGQRVIVSGRLATNGSAFPGALHLVANAIGPDLRWVTAKVTPISGEQIRNSTHPKPQPETESNQEF